MARPRGHRRDTALKDSELLAAARAVVARRYRRGWHSVGAALRGKSDRIYTAVNLNARYVGRVDVCAEAVALGMAIAAGEKGLEAIVAVQQPRGRSRSRTARIVPPCGVCREMLLDYAPKIDVLMTDREGRLARRPVRELLPDRYEDP
jgi:cytidine deaminase